MLFKNDTVSLHKNENRNFSRLSIDIFPFLYHIVSCFDVEMINKNTTSHQKELTASAFFSTYCFHQKCPISTSIMTPLHFIFNINHDVKIIYKSTQLLVEKTQGISGFFNLLLLLIAISTLDINHDTSLYHLLFSLGGTQSMNGLMDRSEIRTSYSTLRSQPLLGNLHSFDWKFSSFYAKINCRSNSEKIRP